MGKESGAGTKSAANKARSAQQDKPRARLVEEVLWQLSQDILEGVYAPGDRIHEPEVSKRLGISRAPIRGALQALAQEGMVEIIPWRGARIIDPTLDEIIDLFDVLANANAVVARLAATRADEAHLRQYSDQVEQCRRIADQPDPDFFELVRLSYQAGDILVSSCDSTMVANIVRRTGRLAYWLHRFLIPVPTRWIRRSVVNHEKLAEALWERDEARAERAGRNVVMHTRKRFLANAREAERRHNASTTAMPRLERRGPSQTR